MLRYTISVQRPIPFTVWYNINSTVAMLHVEKKQILLQRDANKPLYHVKQIITPKSLDPANKEVM